jgi:hypothetical protein
LSAVVASWNRLLIRTPAHCSAAKEASAAIATGLNEPWSPGTRTAANSPIAIET